MRAATHASIHGDPIGVESIGDYLDTLDERELLAVVGHELGHAIAHVNHPQFARAWATSSGADSGSRRVYALASELTADRFGLLACRDLDAALRVEMRGAIGTFQSVRLDTTSYLDQCRAVAEETMQSGGLIH